VNPTTSPTTTLQIQLVTRRGALMRAIGAIERRGFSIDRLVCDDGQIECRVDPGRRGLASLLRQLRKLEDVRGVRMLTT
jgi:acetolactate synthase regulatory subunit